MQMVVSSALDVLKNAKRKYKPLCYSQKGTVIGYGVNSPVATSSLLVAGGVFNKSWLS